MTSKETPASTKNAGTKGSTTRLMALSSAAVLSVYGVGYVQTQSAADEIAGAESRRRPNPSGARAGGPGQAVQFAPAPASSGPTESVTSAVPEPAALSTPVPAANPAAAPKPTAAVAKLATSTKTDASAATPAEAPVPTLPVAAVAAPELPSVQSISQTAAALTSSATAIALQAPPPKSQWKDGTYLGWGTCRHGDIQASVTVADGKIAVAKIAQCWTRYSCNWLDPVVPQVVARQSPNIDYVSGATQSVDAFYYAVVDALSKAK